MQNNEKQNVEIRVFTNDDEQVKVYNSDNQSLRRLTLLRNQLISHLTSSNKYKVQEITKNTDSSINIGKNLVGYPIVIPYDNEKPILKTEQQERDYQLLKDLFLNTDVMKTSSFNSGKPLAEEQLAPYVKKITRREDNANSPHGLYRIHDKTIGKDVGVQGMIDLGLPKGYAGDKIVESLTFLKKQYLRNGYGRTLIDSFFKHFEHVNKDHIVYTVKYDNAGTHKICTNQIPMHIGMIKAEIGWTNVFTVDRPLAENKEFVSNILLPVFENKFNKAPTNNIEKLEAKRLSDKKDPTPKF